MSTQKRRIIYMTDEEWEWVRAEASRRTTTISEFIRSLLRRDEVAAIRGNVEKMRPLSQPERDAILRKVNRG